MSSSRYGWWSYAKAMIRAYPQLHREYEELHCQNTTADISGMPGGGSASRTVENIAIRRLPGIKQNEHDAVEKAIAEIKKKPYGKDVLKIIDLVFWKQRCTVAGAAMRINCSKTTAFRYHQEFIRLVGKHFFEKMSN